MVTSVPCADDPALAERDRVELLGNVVFEVVERAVLEEDDRAVSLQGADQQALGVGGRGAAGPRRGRGSGRRGPAGSGSAWRPAPSPARRCRGRPPARRCGCRTCTPLGGEVEELVHAQEHEVVPRMDHQRPLAHRGRPDGDAGERVLAVRDVEDPRGTEATVRLRGGAEDPLEVVDADAGDEDAGVRLHALHGGFADRLPVLSRLIVGLSTSPGCRSSTAGKGAVRAAATASSTSTWLSRSSAASRAVQEPSASRSAARRIGQRAIHESTSALDRYPLS